jgi:hypothetical protein
MGPALLFAGASSAMDLMSGLFGYLASKEAAAAAESRGRMIRMEAEAEAQRYAEQAKSLRAKTKLAYLKNGVDLSGSPLDVLDADILTADENISAIRAGGAARALDASNAAAGARNAGRAALIAGISSGISKTSKGAYQSSSADVLGDYNRKDMNPFDGGGLRRRQ